MHLVIVAGGLGSRLAPLTNNIPKFLVNIGKNTGYVEMIRYWSQYSKFTYPEGEQDKELYIEGYDPGSLTVIVNEEYAALVAEYHKMYFPKIPLIVKTVTVANGSAHAILSTCSHLEGKAVTFVWCDVIPDEHIPFDEFGPMYCGANVVFTNYNNSNRYELVREGTGWADMVPALSPTERGGCFGLYHISSFHTNIEYKDGQDFIEVIRQFGKIREHRLESIIDFGDMPKLIRTRSHADEAREFNSVEFVGDDFVLKQATNEQGKSIIAREIGWYTELEKIVGKSERPSVPRAWVATDNSGFFMSRVKGVPVWKAWPELSGVDRLHVIRQIIDESQKLFNYGKTSVGLPQMIRDVRAEAGDKLLLRYDEIRGMIDAFGRVSVVNGHELGETNPVDIINQVTNALVSYYTRHYTRHADAPYGFIHGDLQMSNSMVDPDTLKVTIIDPRGYFGKTIGYGLRDYDTGKLLYALSGYDLFNYSKTFGIDSLKNGELKFTIPTPSTEGIESLVQDYFKPVHYGWLAVCWLGLAQYVKNDPVKSVCAHYHGMVLAESTLRTLD